MEYFYIVVDGGDGSYGVEFVASQKIADYLQDKYPETYPESGGSFRSEGAIDVHVITEEDLPAIEEDLDW